MRTLALLWLCGFLAFARAQHGHVPVEELVNDFIKPNDGLFSNVVEQFGIVSFSPTPAATTSITPTTSPSGSVHPSVSASPSPLASSFALPSLAPSPSPLPSASPSSSKSPMPSSQGRRPSSPRRPASPPLASVTPSASSTSSPAPSASSSSSPSPSPSCIVREQTLPGVSGGPGGFFSSDFGRVARAGTLTGIAVGPGGTGLRFDTTTVGFRKGSVGANDPSLAVPSGETVQTATACADTDVNYLRLELSNGQSIESGSQPASGCVTVTAPPGTEILGSDARVSAGNLRAIRFIARSIC